MSASLPGEADSLAASHLDYASAHVVFPRPTLAQHLSCCRLLRQTTGSSDLAFRWASVFFSWHRPPPNEAFFNDLSNAFQAARRGARRRSPRGSCSPLHQGLSARTQVEGGLVVPGHPAIRPGPLREGCTG